MAPAPGTHIALLRGVNVGGKHRLPMAELVAVFQQAGCTDVRTYIQSGNVLYRPPRPARKELTAELAAELRARLGFEVPLVVRTAAELRALPARNPFLRAGAAPKELHVVFLPERPRAAALRALDPDRSPPDELRVDGRELFLRCPNGLARTKLTSAWIDATLATVSTTRNWNTVSKLIELA